MRLFSKQSGVLTGFALVLILFAVTGLVLRRQLAIQVEAQTWLMHTLQVELELDRAQLLLKDAETGQRGYLYTRNPKYLVTYELAIAKIQPHIDTLQNLTADNALQRLRVPVMRSLAADKLKDLAETVALAQSGKWDEARSIVVSDLGLRLMEEIQNLAAEIRAEEDRLDTERMAEYNRSVQKTVFCIYLAFTLAVLAVVLLAYYILRELGLREKHAREMLEREEWFRVTLTSLGDGVIATDEHGAVTYLNPLAEELIGIRLDAARALPVEQVFPIFNEETQMPVDNPVGKVIEHGRIVGLANHTVLRNSAGLLIPIEDSAAPIRDRDGKLIGVVLVFRDASEQRKTQEILHANEKLVSAARMSATVAHEINNPLEAVGNLIYIARETPGVPESATEFLRLAEVELERVSHIAKQTLGFYREAKVPELVDVPVMIDYILRLYSNKLKGKNIRIDRQFGPCPPVQAVSGELQQAVSNLVSNAADAVDEHGTIRIHLSCVEEVDGKSIRVVIEDDGPGIAPEHIPRVFEPFFTTKKNVGNGLGLWVTKEIIERHRGRIHVQSGQTAESPGAVFTVTIPCQDFRGAAVAELTAAMESSTSSFD